MAITQLFQATTVKLFTGLKRQQEVRFGISSFRIRAKVFLSGQQSLKEEM